MTHDYIMTARISVSWTTCDEWRNWSM